MPVNSLDTLEIIPTGAAVGAEIRGIDFTQAIPDDVADALRQAWYDHLVVYFHGQNLKPKQFVTAVRFFGEPQVGGARKYWEAAGIKLPDIPREMSINSNLDADGKPALRNHSLGSLEVIWHSDNSYVDKPPAGSCLYAIDVPEGGSGNTSFNNQYLAYETLDDDLKKAIAGRCSKHDASRNSAGELRPGIDKPEKPEDVPGPMHPLVRIHPFTKKPALYLGRRRDYPSQYIEGYLNDESEALLDKLWAHATDDKLKWTQKWQPGDFLIWDNRCAMHRREVVDHTQRRFMYRTQFLGEDVSPT
jgi:taurine dioxygenase